jgi:hypothetical protein
MQLTKDILSIHDDNPVVREKLENVKEDDPRILRLLQIRFKKRHNEEDESFSVYSPCFSVASKEDQVERDASNSSRMSENMDRLSSDREMKISQASE